MSLPDNPRQLPEFRSRLVDFLATPQARQQFDRFDGMPWHPGAPRLFGDERDFIHGADMLEDEVKGLGEAILFHASENMTGLAVAAGPTMPEFALQSFDLPAEKGFIYYAKPIGSIASRTTGETPGDVVAVRWEVVPPDRGGGEACVWMSFYSNYHSWLAAEDAAGKLPNGELAFYLRQYHELCLETFTFRPINGPDGNKDIDGYEAEWSELDALRRVLFSTWLLLKQPLTRTVEIEADRASRRRMQRAGREPAPVRIIELRRTQASSKGVADREYHHQWVVRGHWRQHWFPAHEVHRPVWIAPHIKGPEGAPMLGGEKVYAWKR